MIVEVLQTLKGDVSYCKFDQNEIIKTVSDFLDVIGNSKSDTILINKNNLIEEFFDLKTGLAGDFLQKVSNYRKRLIIIGNFSNVTSKALTDFIYESNNTGKVIFEESIDKSIDLLR